MLNTLTGAWRARRIVLIGGADELTQLLQAHLTALGARPVRLDANASCEALYRTMTDGRVNAVIACVPLEETALQRLSTEQRETGVPLLLLCPALPAQETALAALRFGAHFFEENLPCGMYALKSVTGEQYGEASPLQGASLLYSCPADTGSG